MLVLGGGAVSYERGAPVGLFRLATLVALEPQDDTFAVELVSDDLTRILSEIFQSSKKKVNFCTRSSFKRTDGVVNIDLVYTSHPRPDLPWLLWSPRTTHSPYVLSCRTCLRVSGFGLGILGFGIRDSGLEFRL